MTTKTRHHRTASPTTVALSSSDFRKLFTPSPDDDVPHYATYSRLQAQELLACLEQAKKREETRKDCDSPVPSLKAIDDRAEVESKMPITANLKAIDAPALAESMTASAAAPRRRPTLRAPTLKQHLHRGVLWPKFMFLHCLRNIVEAVWIVLRDLWAYGGKPSRIFAAYEPLAASGAANYAGTKAPGYSCQLTFTRPFRDRARFRAVFERLCADAGMAAGAGAVRWNDAVELLRDYSPAVTDISGRHYVPNSRSYYAEGSRFKKYHAAVDMYESEDTTIMQAHLPGRAWDGTSCYNFVRELVHRYYSDDSEREASPVFKANDLIRMKDDVRRKLDDPWNIVRWALLVPFNVYSNQSGLCWQQASAAAGIDGYLEIPKELCHVNFNEVQSKRFSAALKRRGVAPTAALVFAGVHAYRLELGELPFSVVLQASLQTRSFEPACKERRFVGDWLIGVLHRVRTWRRRVGIASYAVTDAQRFYRDLIAGLGATDAAVRDGFYSRVLGKLKGGAAAFEKTPCFPGRSRLNDSLFLNNYGPRTVHPDAGCVGFNWSGAGKVGINCILVEGRLCCTVASTQLPLAKVEEIRDTFKSIICAMMDGEDGDEAIKRIVRARA